MERYSSKAQYHKVMFSKALLLSQKAIPAFQLLSGAACGWTSATLATNHWISGSSQACAEVISEHCLPVWFLFDLLPTFCGVMLASVKIASRAQGSSSAHGVHWSKTLLAQMCDLFDRKGFDLISLIVNIKGLLRFWSSVHNSWIN